MVTEDLMLGVNTQCNVQMLYYRIVHLNLVLLTNDTPINLIEKKLSIHSTMRKNKKMPRNVIHNTLMSRPTSKLFLPPSKDKDLWEWDTSGKHFNRNEERKTNRREGHILRIVHCLKIKFPE